MPTRGKSAGTRGRARSQPSQTSWHGRRSHNELFSGCPLSNPRAFPVSPALLPAGTHSPRLAPWPPMRIEHRRSVPRALAVSQSGGKQPAHRAPARTCVRACENTARCCAGAWPTGRWRRAPLHKAVQACCGDQSGQQAAGPAKLQVNSRPSAATGPVVWPRIVVGAVTMAVPLRLVHNDTIFNSSGCTQR
jgi:hypothetical protein